MLVYNNKSAIYNKVFIAILTLLCSLLAHCVWADFQMCPIIRVVVYSSIKSPGLCRECDWAVDITIK